MTSNPVIAGLQDAITGHLRPLLAPGEAYALLDFPDHANVGDSAIWLGELAALQALTGRGPAFVCTKDDFDPAALQRAVPAGPVLLHGGGNFGDIWPAHQAFRETVLAQCPGRTVVQLPQTIHFGDPVARDRAAAAIAAHGRFVLFVRDRASDDLARAHFACPVHAAPDMAFCLGSQPRPRAATHKLLFLLRTDQERAAGMAAPPAGSLTRDWLDEAPGALAWQTWRALAASTAARGLPALHPAHRRATRFRALAEHRLRRGLRLLSTARFVITDRLHAHILCVLLGIPHVVLDNNYGKLTGFIARWTQGCGLVQVAGSLNEAIAMWSAQAARQR